MKRRYWMLCISWRKHHYTALLAVLALLGLCRFWPFQQRDGHHHHHHVLQADDESQQQQQQQQQHTKAIVRGNRTMMTPSTTGVKFGVKSDSSIISHQMLPHSIDAKNNIITTTTKMGANHVTKIQRTPTLDTTKRKVHNNHTAISSSTITAITKKTTPLQIDWLSVGSNTRPELSQTHERLYGAASPWIRHLFAANEDDDADSTCTRVLTVNDTLTIADFCQDRKKDATLPDGAKWVISDQLRYMLLNVTKHPVGWLCAQRRFALALAKVLRQYDTTGTATTTTAKTKSSSLSLPDYLIIVDDDTYYHMPKFVNFLQGKNSADDFMIPGVSYWFSFKPRFRIYHGGYGLTMSRGALHNALQPIYCRDAPHSHGINNFQQEHLFCPRLRENWMGEYDVFRNGMTLMDLVHAYVTTWEPFSNFTTWTTGFCFHGDWVLTYFLSYAYRVGTMHQPYCKFFCKEWKKGVCLPNSHICHHVSAETMEERASMWPTTT